MESDMLLPDKITCGIDPIENMELCHPALAWHPSLCLITLSATISNAFDPHGSYGKTRCFPTVISPFYRAEIGQLRFFAPPWISAPNMTEVQNGYAW